MIIKKTENFKEIIKKGNILVDFYASWCGPCKMLSPELEQLGDEIDILKVDIDENMDLAKEYGVMSVPTLIYFKKDGTTIKNIGYMPKENIIKWIEENK